MRKRTPPHPSHQEPSGKISKVSHKLQFAKAQKEAAKCAAELSHGQSSPPPLSEGPLSQASLQPEELSPDSEEDLPLSTPKSLELDSPSSGGCPPSHSPGVPISASPSPVPRTSQRVEPQPPNMVAIISEAIRQGIAVGLQQRDSPRSSERSRVDRGDRAVHRPRAQSTARVERSLSRSSLPDEEGEIRRNSNLSEDEGLSPDQPAFVGLFKPALQIPAL